MRIENGFGDVSTYSTPINTQNSSASKNEAQQVQSVDVGTSKSPKIQNGENVKGLDDRKKADEQEVIQAIEKANKHIKVYDRRLEFSIHETTKQIMVKVIDTESDTVIREIPSEKILDMVAHLWQVAGIMVDEKR